MRIDEPTNIETTGWYTQWIFNSLTSQSDHSEYLQILLKMSLIVSQELYRKHRIIKLV